MNRHNDNEYIYLSLLHLGAIMWNKASKRLLLALQYVISHDSVTAGPIKHLYTEIAALDNCTDIVIERSLRYAIRRVWECSHAECSKLLYRSKETRSCPTVSEFIFLYADAFKRGIIQAWVDEVEAEAGAPSKSDIRDILDMF